MNEWSGRGRAATAVTALGLMLLVLLTERSGATHFSWLGHTPCPGDSVQCESRVPAGFSALGDFEYGLYRILDEGAPEWRSEERTESLRARDGGLIARVGPRFHRQLDIDGGARLRDGRTITVEEKVAGQWRYLVIEHAPFGIGAPGYKLMPYRTVSVDRRRIRIGTVLYLPALAGTRLPTGAIHDGFCFAHDAHGDGDGIGIFVGFDRETDTTFGRLATKRTLRVYEVDADTAVVLNRRFKDQFAWSG